MFKNIIHTFLTKGMGSIISLLIAVIVSQYLGATGKGIQSIFITDITLVLIFSSIVGPTSIALLIKRYEVSILLIPSYLWSAMVAITSVWLLRIFQYHCGNYSIHIGVLSFFSSLTANNSAILIGKEEIKKHNYILLLQSLLIVICLFVCFFILKVISFDIYILSLYVGYTSSTVVSQLFLKKYLKRYRFGGFGELIKPFIELLRYGAINQVATITQLINARLSYYLLDYYFAKGAVGIYSNGVSIAESIWIISRSFALVLYSKVVNTSDNKQIEYIAVSMIKISSILCFLTLIPLMVIPERVYQLIFGHEFSHLNKIIMILAPGILFYNISILFVHYFNGRGKFHITTMSTLIGLIVILCSALILIPSDGYIGAAIATSLSYISIALSLWICFQLNSKMKWFDYLPNQNDFKLLKKEIKS